MSGTQCSSTRFQTTAIRPTLANVPQIEPTEIPIVKPPKRIGSSPVRALHIALVEPLIPPNTGNAARLCAALGAWLHLIKPLGFSLESRYLKRAGLDYWPNVRLSVHESFDDFIDRVSVDKAVFFTKFAKILYTSRTYSDNSVLIFGKETTGLGPHIVGRYETRLAKIPTTDHVRSLNLSNTVAIAAYEVVRQWGHLPQVEPLESDSTKMPRIS